MYCVALNGALDGEKLEAEPLNDDGRGEATVQSGLVSSSPSKGSSSSSTDEEVGILCVVRGVAIIICTSVDTFAIAMTFKSESLEFHCSYGRC